MPSVHVQLMRMFIYGRLKVGMTYWNGSIQSLLVIISSYMIFGFLQSQVRMLLAAPGCESCLTRISTFAVSMMLSLSTVESTRNQGSMRKRQGVGGLKGDKRIGPRVTVSGVGKLELLVGIGSDSRKAALSTAT